MSRSTVDESYMHEIEASIFKRDAKNNVSPFSRHSFIDLLTHLTSDKKYLHKHTQDILDITSVNVRCSIIGIDDISQYCSCMSFDNDRVKVISKLKHSTPITLNEYPIKIRSNIEKPMDLSHWKSSSQKMFRLKKRFSFETEDNVRVDLTIVKQGSGMSFSQTACEGYEVEVEYIGKYDPTDTNASSMACIEFLTACASLLEISDGGWNHITKSSVLNSVFSDYKKLINKESSLFIGPQPVTLERKHLCMPAPGVLSILKDYTVTDKADGLRMLLFIASDGIVYMLDSRLNIISTGMKVGTEFSGTLLDGEYITRTRLGRLYMAFDIYYNRGEDVRMLPLVAEHANRLNIMQDIVSKISSQPLSIRCKNFYMDSDPVAFLTQCKQIIKDNEIPYSIDGLIFTPKYLPVGGLFASDIPRDGTWKLTFKWKPPEFNSIDFRVDIDKSDISTVSDAYKVATLLVGATDDGQGQLDPLNLKRRDPCNGRYMLRPFNPSFMAHLRVDDDGQMRCENGDGIDDGSIVEFRYDNDRWVPMRVRHDKLRPNFQTVAASNWKSIRQPVSEAMICGQQRVDETDAFDDDAYYLRTYSRDKCATKAMLNFHNHWVKDVCLMGKVANADGTIDSVFDVACGKGNDLPRWLKYKVRSVVGIDIMNDNILNSDDGVYARINSSNGKIMRHAFVTMDASRPIDATTINQIEHPSLREIGRSIWGIEQTSRTRNIFCLATDKFKLVTCNFAVHYFFKTEESLKNFVATVARHVAKGGYFIGTCFDKARIEMLLKNVSIGDDVSNEKDGRIIWSITRLFDESSPEFGVKIAVYIETIGKKNDEYLVDFQRLKFELAKHNIVLWSECEGTGTFDELFDGLLKSPDVKRSKYLSGAQKMSDVEKQLSFLNRWFIFKRMT